MRISEQYPARNAGHGTGRCGGAGWNRSGPGRCRRQAAVSTDTRRPARRHRDQVLQMPWPGKRRCEYQHRHRAVAGVECDFSCMGARCRYLSRAHQHLAADDARRDRRPSHRIGVRPLRLQAGTAVWRNRSEKYRFRWQGTLLTSSKSGSPIALSSRKLCSADGFQPDDKGTMTVNGAPVELSGHSLGSETQRTRTFSHTLAGPGTYTLKVEVDQLGGGPFGMVLNGTANGK